MISKHNVKHLVATGVLLLSTLGLGACSNLGYYLDAMGGHLEIINASRPIEQWLTESSTPEEVKEALRSAQQARQFASHELGLPKNKSYTEYADLHRPYAIWNVIAAKEFSVQPQSWCFVFTGCISYRGYYTEAKAQAFAKELQQQGLETYVGGVQAYSTLGWTSDPLLNTMLRRDKASVAGLIFHELAHQELYVENDSAFNESFATTVELDGLQRWFASQNDSTAYQEYVQRQKRRQQLNVLLQQTRDDLKALYAEAITPQQMRAQKAAAFAALKQRYSKMKQGQWQGYKGYDAWMAQDLNNAHLAIIATYHEWVPAFQAVLSECQGKLACFYSRARQLGEMTPPARLAALSQYKARELARK